MAGTSCLRRRLAALPDCGCGRSAISQRASCRVRTAATSPFWSSDSRWIGFFAGGKLNKIQVDGGPPLLVASTPGRDGAWHDDTILFAIPNGPIQQVAAGGGAASPVTTLRDGETDHQMPAFLPDGRRFLFLATSGPDVLSRTFTLWIGSLDSPDRTPLGPAESNTAYLSGHLLFARGDTVMAQPFDASAACHDRRPVHRRRPCLS